MKYSGLERRLIVTVFYLLLGLSFAITGDGILSATAANPELPLAEVSSSLPLEERGQEAYNLARYEEAVQLWSDAQEIATKQRNWLLVAKLKGKIAFAHHRGDNLSAADTEMEQALEIATAQPRTKESHAVLAQLLNNQGIMEVDRGNSKKAIDLWDRAMASYEKAENPEGVVRTLLNQARSYKSLGLYKKATDSLSETANRVATMPDSQLKAIALRSYGDILRSVGNIEQSQELLSQSLETASSLNLPQEQIEALLSLGHTLAISGDIQGEDLYYQQALTQYEKGLSICEANNGCSEEDLYFSLRLAKLNLAQKTQSWDEAVKMMLLVKHHLPEIAQNPDQIDLKISLADSLLKLRQKTAGKTAIQASIPDADEIIKIIDTAIADAQRFQDLSAQSHAWGLRGQILELQERWEEGSIATAKALQIAQNIDSKEIGYLWAWQLGRIDRARGAKKQAIANYLQAVTLLEALSHDVANIDNSVQYSFRDQIEPVYRETVALLLDSDSGTVSQDNLIRARDTLESLQIAELNNFFRAACIEGEFVAIDEVDRKAAAIYPIVLSDRLELILSLPGRPLQHYRVDVTQQQLEETIQAFRDNIVIRSRRQFFAPAQDLYSWLIAPLCPDLKRHHIETLVFIPDGALRNIPLSALYDGKKYLIENYSLVLNPGLQLLDPQPLQNTKLNALAVGLSQPQDNFAPLEHVNAELAQIQQQVKSEILLNEEFTTEALKKEIAFSDYPIVHIATHGQFSSSLDDTFLLAWNDRINLNELQDILQTRENSQRAIELLVLSACETATGDDRATLGLAGIAIQAGAKSTVATLWSINDRATAKLMGELYQEIGKKNLGKAAAIRQAQLSLLQDPQYQHPFYWAAYTTIGNWL